MERDSGLLIDLLDQAKAKGATAGDAILVEQESGSLRLPDRHAGPPDGAEREAYSAVGRPAIVPLSRDS